MNKVIDFFVNAYLNVTLTFLYLIGLSDQVPFSILVLDELEEFELSSCSSARQENTCFSTTNSIVQMGCTEEKCDYRWDRILSTRQITRTYAEAFPGSAQRACSALLTQSIG